MAVTDIYSVCGALQPARNAIRCLGGDVDDYIEVNNAVAARVTANDTKGTFSAWVMIPDITGTYTIFSAAGNAVDDYIDFNIEAGLLTGRCEDGGVVQFVTQEDAVGLTPHKWHHVAMVQAADGMGVRLYIDGVLRASTNDTATDVDEWYNNMDNANRGLIGCSLAGGADAKAQEFKGYISDVKYWNRALTAEHIKIDYGEAPQPLVDLDGTTDISDATYLQNHWTFDNDLIDDGLGADNGTNTGAGIVLCSGVNQFMSRLTFMTGIPVVADIYHIMAEGGVGYAVLIQAA